MRKISTNSINCVESVRSDRIAIESSTHDIDPIPMEMLFFDMALSYSDGSQ